MMGEEDLSSQVEVSQVSRWDRTKCGRHLSVSRDGRTVTKNQHEGSTGSTCLLQGVGTSSFKIRIPDRHWSIFEHGITIGFIKARDFDADEANLLTEGWFVCACPGSCALMDLASWRRIDSCAP